MFKRKKILWVFYLYGIFFFAACSTQNNTFLTRTYHQLTSRYNTFYNGNQSFQAGVRRVEEQFRFDYNRILPVFLYIDPDIASTVVPEMDRAINKASKIIANKSITAKPDREGGLFGGGGEEFYNQNEFNRWVRESYLLAGKAHFYKHDFVSATQAFLFVIREYSMNQIRHEARVWLARTYSERGRFNEVQLLFDELLFDPEFPSALDTELHSTIADFYLKRGNFEEAIIHLEMALESSDDKTRSARYAFILAQLNELTGDLSAASDYYSLVKEMNPPYEMAFNARLAQANILYTEGEELHRVIGNLEKLLKDPRNESYHDRIYYVLGNIYMENGDEENAKKYFTLSASASSATSSQKVNSYLNLADIYFEDADYVAAQAYFDSALVSVVADFPGRYEIEQRNEVLKELVRNISVYQLEDSLQLLASMSDHDRDRVIDAATAGAQEQISQPFQSVTEPSLISGIRPTVDRDAGEGSWYFYNRSAVNFGQREFESIWGDRRLEDNWRRAGREDAPPHYQEDIGEPVFRRDEEVVIDETRPEDRRLPELPLTEEAMIESDLRIQEALLNMGRIFRDDLSNFKKSGEAFREFIRRYPDSEYVPSLLYELYNLATLRDDQQSAGLFRERLVTEYPETPFALILSDPEFLEYHYERAEAAGLYYEETYNLFAKNLYDQIPERVIYAMSVWPDSYLIPKFEYLKTLSYGATGDISGFKEGLNYYIEKYPDTEMALNAGEIISSVTYGYPEIAIENGAVVHPVEYSQPNEGRHLFVIIIDNNQTVINRLLFNIVNFNVDNFARFNLDVSSVEFSSNYRLLRVDGLDNISVAMDYFKMFSASADVFSGVDTGNYFTFIITPGNFDLFMKEKNVSSYLEFFNDEYLNR